MNQLSNRVLVAPPEAALPDLLHRVFLANVGYGPVAALVLTILIGVLSFVVNAIADVEWPNGAKARIGMPCLLVAPSGTGKSATFQKLWSPIHAYLFKRVCLGDLPEDWGMLAESTTREAIIEQLKAMPWLFLMCEEGGALKGLLKDAPVLAKLIDGSPLRHARVSTGRVSLMDYCFSMLIMVQPKVYEEIKPHFGPNKGTVGLGNRFFIASSPGFESADDLHSTAFTGEIEQFYIKKMVSLLDMSITQTTGSGGRPCLKLKHEAQQFFKQEDRRMRMLGQPDAMGFPIREYISRHAQRTLCLAAAFHVFEFGVQGEISLETTQRAAAIAAWYVDAYEHVNYEPPKFTQVEQDAVKLGSALTEWQSMWPSHVPKLSDLRTRAANLGLTPSRFSRAFALLGEQKKVHVYTQGNLVLVHIFPPALLFG